MHGPNYLRRIPRRPRHAWDDGSPPSPPSRPKQRDPGEYTDSTFSAPPPSTLSLAYTSLPLPSKGRHSAHESYQGDTKGPVKSLMDLSALQLARSLELVDPEDLRPGGRLSAEAVRCLVGWLVEGNGGMEEGLVGLGNWVRLGMEWGEAVMSGLPEVRGRELVGVPSFFDPTPARLPPELIPTTHHRTLPLHASELLNSLKASPCISPLLGLSRNLVSQDRMNLLVTLSLAGTEFTDADASCLRVLGCLVGLDLDRTKATDATVRTMASALYIPPESAGERRGLWQLRGWTMRGCGGVTDRSAKSFRDFAQLSFLDVSHTSCTHPVFLNALSSTSSWTASPSAILHTHLRPTADSLLPTPLSLHIHHPIQKGLRPAPLPVRRLLGANALVSVPLTRVLPRFGEVAPKGGPSAVEGALARNKRAPEEEQAQLKKKKKPRKDCGFDPGPSSAGADLMALITGTSAIISQPSFRHKLYRPPSSSPSKAHDFFPSSSSPVRPASASAPRSKPKPNNPRPNQRAATPPSPTSSHSSDIQIISPPPRPRPLKAIAPSLGMAANPFAAKKGLPPRGGGSTTTTALFSKAGLGAGPAVAVTGKIQSSFAFAPKKVSGGGVEGDGWAERPKGRKKAGEGGVGGEEGEGEVGGFYFRGGRKTS